MRFIRFNYNEDSVMAKVREYLRSKPVITGTSIDIKLNFAEIAAAQLKDKPRPTIMFSQQAYMKIMMLVWEMPKELAWHGVVNRIDEHTFLIEDVLVYPQVASAAKVDSDDERYNLWLMNLDDEIYPKIRMQGHSHVNMSPGPSGTDTAFYEQMLQCIRDYYIFMIINKSGEMTLFLYDVVQNIVFETKDIDMSIVCADGSDAKAWATEAVKMILSSKPATTYSPAAGAGTVIYPRTPINQIYDEDEYYNTYGYGRLNPAPAARAQSAEAAVQTYMGTARDTRAVDPDIRKLREIAAQKETERQRILEEERKFAETTGKHKGRGRPRK